MNYQSFDLDVLRGSMRNRPQKTPFPHQRDALEALCSVFNFKGEEGKGGLLVIPTGGGKTFTAVKWICAEVLTRDVKILWLAHSHHLLDQAAETLVNSLHEVSHKRRLVNIRVISSSAEHSRPADIKKSDDVLIMTTPSAISNFEINALDRSGIKAKTAFRQFIDSLKGERLLVVLDEAHHAPAYGCRNLMLGLRRELPSLYLLGLTATPSYSDETRRGWLIKLFGNGVIFEAKKQNLYLQKILARENYIQRQTNIEYEVDEKLYNRLVMQHKDLPEDIIESIANNMGRNDMIVEEYCANRALYGKTIIFVDRWYQCLYLKDKLREKGIQADAVFSHIAASESTPEKRNEKVKGENTEIIEAYKKSNLEVLINVKMLTEGTDVPDTRTVFITRNTTSQVLLTQMIGRALRGEKAGGGSGKNDANIVLFNDTWKKLITWADPELEGGTDETRPEYEGRPMRLISINLVEKLVRQVNSGIVYNPEPFLALIPIGWYETQFVSDVSENSSEEYNSVSKVVLVYNRNEEQFRSLIIAALTGINEELRKERIDEAVLSLECNRYLERFFPGCEDGEELGLASDIISILRHIGQNENEPVFRSIDDREKYDLDSFAKECLNLNQLQLHQALIVRYNEPGSFWKDFYPSFSHYQTAFQASLNRLLDIEMYGHVAEETIPLSRDRIEYEDRELSEAEKEQVKKRDGYRCLSCGIERGRGIRLEIDHILPIKLGGRTTLDNSQTLCKYCNGYKGINEINFMITATGLKTAKPVFEPIPPAGFDDLKTSEGLTRCLRRVINFFYHCNAVADVELHIRQSGKNYEEWHIELYEGNNPAWLQKFESDFLRYIREDLQRDHVKAIHISGARNEGRSLRTYVMAVRIVELLIAISSPSVCIKLRCTFSGTLQAWKSWFPRNPENVVWGTFGTVSIDLHMHLYINDN